MMKISSVVRKFRDNYHVSRVLARVLFPVQRACLWLNRQIVWKVRMNGATVERDGMRLVFPRDVGVMYCSLFWWLGMEGYEPRTWLILKHFLERCKTFYDIGSNIGLYSVLARRVSPRVVVETFEPIPSLYEGNRRFHMANGYATEGIHHVALSDEEGSVLMNVYRYAGQVEVEPTATAESGVNLSPGAVAETITVNRIRLDQFVATHAPKGPMLIKLDVEGHELAVLRGATDTLAHVRPIMICEMLPSADRNREVMLLLEKAGYRAFAICKEGLFRMQLEDFALGRDFTDFLCLPEEACGGMGSYTGYADLNRIRVGI